MPLSFNSSKFDAYQHFGEDLWEEEPEEKIVDMPQIMKSV